MRRRRGSEIEELRRKRGGEESDRRGMEKETEDIQENERQCNCRHHISYPLSENQKLQCCNRMQ